MDGRLGGDAVAAVMGERRLFVAVGALPAGLVAAGVKGLGVPVGTGVDEVATGRRQRAVVVYRRCERRGALEESPTAAAVGPELSGRSGSPWDVDQLVQVGQRPAGPDWAVRQ